MIDRHSEDIQTLHAELLALLLAREGERRWSHLAGAFTTKSLGGRDYVYFQYSDAGGTKRQLSITAYPLFAQADEFVGAVAIFWEHGTEEAVPG